MKKLIDCIFLLSLLFFIQSCGHYMEAEVRFCNTGYSSINSLFLGNYAFNTLNQYTKTNYKFVPSKKYIVKGRINNSSTDFSKEIELIYGYKYTILINSESVELLREGYSDL